MPRYEIRNTSDSSLSYVEDTLPLDLMLHVAAGTYRAKAMSAEAAADIVVPVLDAGTISPSSPEPGDVSFSLTGGNIPSGATYSWLVNAVEVSTAASPTLTVAESDTVDCTVTLGDNVQTASAAQVTVGPAAVTSSAIVIDSSTDTAHLTMPVDHVANAPTFMVAASVSFDAYAIGKDTPIVSWDSTAGYSLVITSSGLLRLRTEFINPDETTTVKSAFNTPDPVPAAGVRHNILLAASSVTANPGIHFASKQPGQALQYSLTTGNPQTDELWNINDATLRLFAGNYSGGTNRFSGTSWGVQFASSQVALPNIEDEATFTAVFNAVFPDDSTFDPAGILGEIGSYDALFQGNATDFANGVVHQHDGTNQTEIVGVTAVENGNVTNA